MKHTKILLFLLLIALCLLFCACGESSSEESVSEETKAAIETALVAAEELSRQVGVIPEEEINTYADVLPLDITVRTGVLDLAIDEVTVNENIANAEYHFVGWDVRILSEDDQYKVTMTFSQYNATAELMNDKEFWSAHEKSIQKQEGMPSGYDGTKGTYTTFDEAYAAAKEIDPEKENPIF